MAASINIEENVTNVWRWNWEALKRPAEEARLIANKGGTRSGKTFSIISMFVYFCEWCSKKDRSIDVVSESFPHLKRGALLDMEDNLDRWQLVEGVHYNYNRSDHVFTFFSTGCEMRFFPADDWGKVKGSRRDILYINEANRIEYEVYRQLAVRTTEQIFIDWNPDAEFWYETKQLNLRKDTVEIHSTYKDNPFLSPIQVAEIESNKDDEEWWKVYGLGLTGHAQGIVYKNWKQVEEIPPYATLIGHGLDFGYMNDPTALVSIYYADHALWLDELLYMPGLTNDKIAERLRGLDGAIVADSAEMKSIDEIKNYGIRNIEPAVKGNDSIKNGIQILQRYPLNITSRSLNLIKEVRNYKYKENKITGEITNEPVDKFNHLLDAARYVALNKITQTRPHNRPRAKLRQI